MRMANKYMKRCSTSLITREVQIRTTVRAHRTPIRMAPFKRTESNKGWQGCIETGTFVHWWNVKWYGRCGKQYGGSSQKWKIELPYDPAVLLSTHPKEMEARTQKGICPFMFIALFTAKRWKQPRCPLMDDRGKTCGWCTKCTISTLKKGQSDTCFNMNEPRGHYASHKRKILYKSAGVNEIPKINQSHRDRKY